MNEIAEVVYAYSPKNDDELELTVGDKIEVIGFVEDGWWRGKLKGQIGLFPSNFVEVKSMPITNPPPSSIQQQHSATSNKLNSIFSSKLGSKTSLCSSNSLNTINTSNNSLNNNLAAHRNIIDNNMDDNYPAKTGAEPINSLEGHQHQHGNEFANKDDSKNNSFNERRPKPIRGVGYGDIFAAGAKPPKPLQAALGGDLVGGSVTSEKLNNDIVGGILQKPIPKKPPPPTPASINIQHELASTQNGLSSKNIASSSASSDQAPALPPKPNNQSFGSFMQQSRALPQQPTSTPSSVTRRQGNSVREQARVIHAYVPAIDDELELKVNDIINIIDKKSEDYGWWTGELNGKIGVFPDNYVQLIPVQDQASQQAPTSTANQSEWQSNRIGGSNSTATATSSSVFSPPQQQQIGNNDGRIKSVFSSTPKGFSKELESNLEKHNNNPASFLSLKRNKLTSQSTNNESNSASTQDKNSTLMNMGFVSSTKNDATTTPTSMNGNSIETSSPTKLNHITANRAKGPTRRPPSNVLSRRTNQSMIDPYGTVKNESPNSSRDSSKDDQQQSMIGSAEPSITSTNTSVPSKKMPNDQQDNLVSSNNNIPRVNQEAKQSSGSTFGPQTTSPSSVKATVSSVSSAISSLTSTRPNTIIGNGATGILESSIQLATAANTSTVVSSAPKTSHRSSQQINSSDTVNSITAKGGQKTPTSAGSPPTSTPPWMVNLRKTNAEKKRDPVPTPTTPALPNSVAIAPATPCAVTVAAAAATTVNGNTTGDLPASFLINGSNNVNLIQNQAQAKQPEQIITNAVSANNASKLSSLNAQTCYYPVATSTQLEEFMASIASLQNQISKNVTSEISELKKDVKKIYEDLEGINQLKSAIETMRIEIRTCQSATDNQRKYIKELVSNLADERKKIAALQEELDRNLR